MHQLQRGTIYIEQMHTPGEYHKIPDSLHTQYEEMCAALNADKAIEFTAENGNLIYIPKHNIAELKFRPDTN